MALMKCKECGGSVSSKAKTCPTCGAKVPKKVGLLGWLLVIFVVLPVAWQVGSNMGTSGDSKAASVDAPPKWERFEYNDAMTDAKGVVLSLRSKNSTHFDPPYQTENGSYLTINLRRVSGVTEAFLTVDKGQMLCGVRNCSFSLRLGNGQVESWAAGKSSSGDTDIMFVGDVEDFLAVLRSRATVRIGIEFYRAGTRAFEFDGIPPPAF